MRSEAMLHAHYRMQLRCDL